MPDTLPTAARLNEICISILKNCSLGSIVSPELGEPEVLGDAEPLHIIIPVRSVSLRGEELKVSFVVASHNGAWGFHEGYTVSFDYPWLRGLIRFTWPSANEMTPAFMKIDGLNSADDLLLFRKLLE